MVNSILGSLPNSFTKTIDTSAKADVKQAVKDSVASREDDKVTLSDAAKKALESYLSENEPDTIAQLLGDDNSAGGIASLIGGDADKATVSSAFSGLIESAYEGAQQKLNEDDFQKAADNMNNIIKGYQEYRNAVKA